MELMYDNLNIVYNFKGHCLFDSHNGLSDTPFLNYPTEILFLNLKTCVNYLNAKISAASKCKGVKKITNTHIP